MAKWLTEEIQGLLDSKLSEKAAETNTQVSLDEAESSLSLWDRVTASPSLFAECFLSNPDNPKKPFHAIPPQDEILDSPYKYNTLRMRRRRGKTITLAILALHYATVHKGSSVICIFPQMTHLQGFISVLERLLNNSPLEHSGRIFPNKGDKLFKVLGGVGEEKELSTIRMIITNPAAKKMATNLRGWGGHLILIDEADFLLKEDYGTIIPLFSDQRFITEHGKCFVASTINYRARTTFYSWCTSEQPTDSNDKQHWKAWWLPGSMDDTYTEEERTIVESSCNYDPVTIAAEVECTWDALPGQLVNPADIQCMFSFPESSIIDNDLDSEYFPPTIYRTCGIDWNQEMVGIRFVVLDVVDYKKFPDPSNPPFLYRIHHVDSVIGDDNVNASRDKIIDLYNNYRVKKFWVDKGDGYAHIQGLGRWAEEHKSDIMANFNAIDMAVKPHLTTAFMDKELAKRSSWKRILYDRLLLTFRQHSILAGHSQNSIRSELADLSFDNQGNVVDNKDHFSISLALALMPAVEFIQPHYKEFSNRFVESMFSRSLIALGGDIDYRPRMGINSEEDVEVRFTKLAGTQAGNRNISFKRRSSSFTRRGV